MRSLCLSHSTPLPPCSPSSCLICTTWRGVKIRTVSMWSGGLWGGVVSQWLSHSWPTFFGLRDRRDFYDLYMGRWLYGRVARHDCWVKSGERRQGREGGTTNICMLTAHRQKHKETHRKCIESHGLSAFGFALCFCFISFTTFVAVVAFVEVCFGFFVPFWARIRKSFESPLSSAVWMHSWMLFGGAFFFFFNFAFAFV